MLYGLTISAPTENGKKVLTMDEYIDRKGAVDAVLDVYYDTPDIDLSGEKFEAAILKIPAADVAPVRHGEWEIVVGSNGKEYMVCTCCRVSQDLTGVFTYCPNCGAKMDGGDSDAVDGRRRR